jgi:hypothetical protein
VTSVARASARSSSSPSQLAATLLRTISTTDDSPNDSATAMTAWYSARADAPSPTSNAIAPRLDRVWIRTASDALPEANTWA